MDVYDTFHSIYKAPILKLWGGVTKKRKNLGKFLKGRGRGGRFENIQNPVGMCRFFKNV